MSMNMYTVTLILKWISMNSEAQNDNLYWYEKVCALHLKYFSDITNFISIVLSLVHTEMHFRTSQYFSFGNFTIFLKLVAIKWFLLLPDCSCHLQILINHLKDDDGSRSMEEALVIPFWGCPIAPVQLLCLQRLLHPFHIVCLHVLQTYSYPLDCPRQSLPHASFVSVWL